MSREDDQRTHKKNSERFGKPVCAIPSQSPDAEAGTPIDRRFCPDPTGDEIADMAEQSMLESRGLLPAEFDLIHLQQQITFWVELKPRKLRVILANHELPISELEGWSRGDCVSELVRRYIVSRKGS